MDFRTIFENFTLGFCMRRKNYRGVNARTVEHETCHTRITCAPTGSTYLVEINRREKKNAAVTSRMNFDNRDIRNSFLGRCLGRSLQFNKTKTKPYSCFVLFCLCFVRFVMNVPTSCRQKQISIHIQQR